jgi:hypothetical protein
MYVTATESRVLARIFGLLSEDMGERDVREAVGNHLLELLGADYYASFVWQEATKTFGKAVFLNMDPKNVANYDAYYQYHDPITFKLQARREATLVTWERRRAACNFPSCAAHRKPRRPSWRRPHPA